MTSNVLFLLALSLSVYLSCAVPFLNLNLNLGSTYDDVDDEAPPSLSLYHPHPRPHSLSHAAASRQQMFDASPMPSAEPEVFPSPAVSSAPGPGTVLPSTDTPLSTATPTPTVDAPSDEPSPSPEADDSVCVSTQHLYALGFSAGDMVHAVAFQADVLCPPVATGLPCGTPHHMVRLGGKDASYAMLCARKGVECQRKRMLVNSVLSHVWDEAVHGRADQGAVLTMFDYRHPQRLQVLLHQAIALKRRVVG